MWYFTSPILSVNMYHRVLCVSQSAGGSLWASTALRWRAACSAVRGRSYTRPSSNITSDSCCREPPGAAERGAPPPSRTRVRRTQHTEGFKGTVPGRKFWISQIYFFNLFLSGPRLTAAQCVDGMAAGLYEELFTAVVSRINRYRHLSPLSTGAGWVHTCSLVYSVQHFKPGLVPVPVQTDW